MRRLFYEGQNHLPQNRPAEGRLCPHLWYYRTRELFLFSGHIYNPEILHLKIHNPRWDRYQEFDNFVPVLHQRKVQRKNHSSVWGFRGDSGRESQIDSGLDPFARQFYIFCEAQKKTSCSFLEIELVHFRNPIIKSWFFFQFLRIV